MKATKLLEASIGEYLHHQGKAKCLETGHRKPHPLKIDNLISSTFKLSAEESNHILGENIHKICIQQQIDIQNI